MPSGKEVLMFGVKIRFDDGTVLRVKKTYDSRKLASEAISKLRDAGGRFITGAWIVPILRRAF